MSLHFQRSHELTDAALAQALAALPSVRSITLTTCRQITTGARVGSRCRFARRGPRQPRHLLSLCCLCFLCCLSSRADMVVHVARLRRPVRLRVAGCRLVSARGWEAAVLAARGVQGCALVDVRYPSEEDVGLEVAFE